MKYATQRFSQKDHEKFDSWAKDATINYFISKGYRAGRIPGKYELDVEVWVGDTYHLVEVEGTDSISWTCREDYPKSRGGCSFLPRKNEGNFKGKTFLYYRICMKTKAYYMQKSDVIYTEGKQRDTNCKRTESKGSEPLWYLPTSRCHFGSLEIKQKQLTFEF